MKAELYDQANEGGHTTISLELNPDGSVQLFYHDVGPAALEMFGDSDYEAWLTVSAASVPALCFALLKQGFSGDGQALTRARDLCNRSGIDHEFGVWT
ncbi:hypothetical protein GCM10022276_13060 [Sphingomonas limnosediminicola]|uniref:Uncharacterized protein n=1 Tax=Sphingomonas limnosediminicola TaxID=940133 RepID=A0ABP7L942_9SPHN